MRSRASIITSALSFLVLAFSGPLCAQPAVIDGAAFVDLSMKALIQTKAEDRRGARAMFSQQIALLTTDQKLGAHGALVGKLRTEDTSINIETATILGLLNDPWNTRHQAEDIALIYKLFLDAKEETHKNALDNALANAHGLYRHAIQDYNDDRVSDPANVAGRLATMADKYVRSRYAENASFYMGQLYTKAFFVGHPKGKVLIADSNSAYENYIKRAEKGDFVKTDFLAGGYFFRALNGLIVNDMNDAREWLKKGAQKFSDSDRVYVFQLFYSKDKETWVDRRFPAKTLFQKTLNFLDSNPKATPEQQKQLLAAIR